MSDNIGNEMLDMIFFSNISNVDIFKIKFQFRAWFPCFTSLWETGPVSECGPCYCSTQEQEDVSR